MCPKCDTCKVKWVKKHAKANYLVHMQEQVHLLWLQVVLFGNSIVHLQVCMEVGLTFCSLCKTQKCQIKKLTSKGRSWYYNSKGWMWRDLIAPVFSPHINRSLKGRDQAHWKFATSCKASKYNVYMRYICN